MEHYICTGECKGVSDSPGMCQAESCSKHNSPLEMCDCQDGNHHERQTHDEPPPEDLAVQNGVSFRQ